MNERYTSRSVRVYIHTYMSTHLYKENNLTTSPGTHHTHARTQARANNYIFFARYLLLYSVRVTNDEFHFVCRFDAGSFEED